MVTGLQSKFDWRGVAASAAGAAAGAAVGAELGLKGDAVENLGAAEGWKKLELLGKYALQGIASSTVNAVVRGGKVDMATISTDAFGTALGNSVVGNIQASARQEQKLREQIYGSAAANPYALGTGSRPRMGLGTSTRGLLNAHNGGAQHLNGHTPMANVFCLPCSL